MAKVPTFVGIDLGTTYSAVAHINAHGKVEIIPNDRSQPVTPSVVMFPEDRDEEPTVGERARRLARFAPDRVVEHVKRHMGDPTWNFRVDGETYNAEEVSAIILRDLKNQASRHLSKEVTEAVITVPAYFDEGERHATKLAGELAGFRVLGILNEPIAAALAYGLDHAVEQGRALVYDLGGGTFDVTVVEVDGGKIKVLATDGVRLLGGIDWDSKLSDYLAHEFMVKHGPDPREDLKSAQRLADEVEAAKRSLSSHTRAKLFLECADVAGTVPVTREKFEDLTEGLLLQTEAYTEAVLEKAELSWGDISTILLAGGSTRMPMVRNMLRDLSGKEPDSSLNPDECVAIGACYYASKLKDNEGNGLSSISVAVSELAKSIQVENVASHSIGIQTVIDGNRTNLVMIREQTPLPTEVTRYFATHSDNQVTVEVNVLEGDSEDPLDCSLLGTAVIRGLPSNRVRGSKVSVTYMYSDEGLLTVRAHDVETGQHCEAMINRGVASDKPEQVEMMRHKIDNLFLLEGETAEAAPVSRAMAPPRELALGGGDEDRVINTGQLHRIRDEMNSIAGSEPPADEVVLMPGRLGSDDTDELAPIDPWSLAKDQGLLEDDLPEDPPLPQDGYEEYLPEEQPEAYDEGLLEEGLLEQDYPPKDLPSDSYAVHEDLLEPEGYREPVEDTADFEAMPEPAGPSSEPQTFADSYYEDDEADGYQAG